VKPIRIQLSRKKGWRIPTNTVVVSRPSKWGNPFRIAYYRDVVHYEEAFARQTAVDFFRECCFGKDEANNPEYQERLVWIREHVQELRGKNLACWCPLVDGTGNRVSCHADVLLEVANK
jgi:hypothetical protein